MAGTPDRHRRAAAHHEAAAARHDSAVAYWEAHGDAPRAELHRDLAAHERDGAALHLRWAQLPEPETSDLFAAGSDDQREVADEVAEAAMRRREQHAANRSWLVDEREGTDEERERERLQRLRDAEARERARDQRDEYALEREIASSREDLGPDEPPAR